MNRILSTVTRPGRTIAMFIAATLAAIILVTGLGAPVSAGSATTYASTPYNQMWHRGTVQFYNTNQKFDMAISFNDVAGDAYCTQLRVKAYASNGSVTLFNMVSVCGGRSATWRDTITAATGARLTKIEIWTVRADGGARSYVWAFTP